MESNITEDNKTIQKNNYNNIQKSQTMTQEIKAKTQTIWNLQGTENTHHYI